VAKQFGNIRKMLKKNLGISKSSKSANKYICENFCVTICVIVLYSRLFENEDQVDCSTQQQECSRRIVSNRQAYILGAQINTGRIFPYQFEMVNNYLEVNKENLLSSNNSYQMHFFLTGGSNSL